MTGIDILPTVLKIANIQPGKEIAFDGIDILPLVKDGKKSFEDRMILWRYYGGKGWVARQGDYKLIHLHHKHQTMLFNLEKDPYEHYNIADNGPQVVEQLKQAYMQWDAEMMQPLWDDPHIPNVEQEEKKFEEIKKKASSGQRYVCESKYVYFYLEELFIQEKESE